VATWRTPTGAGIAGAWAGAMGWGAGAIHGVAHAHEPWEVAAAPPSAAANSGLQPPAPGFC